jgi:hypothetical protein
VEVKAMIMKNFEQVFQCTIIVPQEG